MFYILTKVHYQIAACEVLPPPNRFWYYMPYLLYRIQNMAAVF